jgi:hypothetical protein
MIKDFRFMYGCSQDCNKKADGIESLSTTKVVLQKESSILHTQLHLINCGGSLSSNWQNYDYTGDCYGRI